MATTRFLTLDAFLSLPREKPYTEFARSEASARPSANVEHASIQLFLGALLRAFLLAHGLGRAFPELELRLGPPGDPRVYVVDLCVYLFASVSPERLRAVQHPTVAPNLAIEILSPGQPDRRFADKIAFYRASGVRLVWVIDPLSERVRVLAPDEPERLLTTADTLAGGAVLPGFTVPVVELFTTAYL